MKFPRLRLVAGPNGAGKSRKIQQQGGWKDMRMLVERYIRGARIFEDNAMNEVW